MFHATIWARFSRKWGDVPFGLQAVALSVEQLPLAYPLIQMRYPLRGLGAWIAYGKKYLDGEGRARGGAGVVSVQNPQGRIVAIFTYRIGLCLAHGNVLECGELVALHVRRGNGIAKILMRTIRDLAHHKRCEAVRLNLLDADDPLVEPAREAELLPDEPRCCVLLARREADGP